MRRALPWLLALGVIASGLQLWFDRPLRWRPGVMAADEPLQTALDAGTPESAIEAAWLDSVVLLTPRARFAATVRVLARERYRFDRLASVIPEDLAVGWGPMSDSAVLDRLDISQGARFYSWHTEDPPIALEQISLHSANWHIVPANKNVLGTIKRIRVGDIVRLTGELVDLDKPGDWFARTSLTRDDTGAGACEIVLVQQIEILWRH